MGLVLAATSTKPQQDSGPAGPKMLCCNPQKPEALWKKISARSTLKFAASQIAPPPPPTSPSGKLRATDLEALLFEKGRCQCSFQSLCNSSLKSSVGFGAHGAESKKFKRASFKLFCYVLCRRKGWRSKLHETSRRRPKHADRNDQPLHTSSSRARGGHRVSNRFGKLSLSLLKSNATSCVQ